MSTQIDSFFAAQSCSNVLQPIGEFPLEATIGGAVVGAIDAQVILRGDGIWRVVGVLVTFTVAEALGAGVMRVLQVPRHWQQSAFAHVLACFADRKVGRIRFWCAGE